MDAHWKFSVNDAIKLAQALEPFDLLWLEDPVPPENIEAQRHVTHSTRTPICTGENLYRKHGFRELIEKQAARIIAPDIPKMGGLAGGEEGRRLGRHLLHPDRAAQCRQPDRHRGRRACLRGDEQFPGHGIPRARCPLVGGSGRGEPTIVDGFIYLNDRPGHGLTLNEDVAKAHLKAGSSYFGDEAYG